MKNIYYFFFAMILFASCQESIEPDVRIYQVINQDDITIPITTEDNMDGTGFLLGNLVFDNMETRFTANYDYVSSDKTNFSLSISGDQMSQTFVSGSGYFTSDSISISIFRVAGGIEFEEAFFGSR